MFLGTGPNSPWLYVCLCVSDCLLKLCCPRPHRSSKANQQMRQNNATHTLCHWTKVLNFLLPFSRSSIQRVVFTLLPNGLPPSLPWSLIDNNFGGPASLTFVACVGVKTLFFSNSVLQTRLLRKPLARFSKQLCSSFSFKDRPAIHRHFFSHPTSPVVGSGRDKGVLLCNYVI